MGGSLAHILSLFFYFPRGGDAVHIAPVVARLGRLGFGVEIFYGIFDFSVQTHETTTGNSYNINFIPLMLVSSVVTTTKFISSDKLIVINKLHTGAIRE